MDGCRRIDMQDLTAYGAALLSSVTIRVLIPLLILFVLLGIAWRLLTLAQRKAGFNIEQMFTDEQGKASAARFLAMMAFAISSWALAVQVFAATLTPELFFYYLAAWSGALVFTKFADKWDGSLPFGKGVPGAAPTTPPTP
jgi:hypothetical protein